jgi:hypothetical protein
MGIIVNKDEVSLLTFGNQFCDIFPWIAENPASGGRSGRQEGARAIKSVVPGSIPACINMVVI